jgi:hypothetical protein
MNNKEIVGFKYIFSKKGFGFRCSECHSSNIYFKLKHVVINISKNYSVLFVRKNFAQDITPTFLLTLFIYLIMVSTHNLSITVIILNTNDYGAIKRWFLIKQMIRELWNENISIMIESILVSEIYYDNINQAI